MPEQQQIFHGAVADAPADYPVAANVELILKQVNAEIDGSAAGSAYLPAVVLLSDSGHVIGRYINRGEPIAAGASAEVTWFPGVKEATAAAAGTPLDWAWGVRNAGIFGDAAFSCPSNSATAHPFPHTFGSTNGAFSWLTSSNPNDLLQFNKVGLYAVVAASQWSASGAVVRAALSNPNTAISLHGDTTANTITDANLGGLGTLWTLDISLFEIGGVPDDTALLLFQQSGGAINVRNASLGAFYFGAA